MAESQRTEQPIDEQPVDEHEGIDLKGTLASVSILALIILVSWFGVWYLFISR